MERPSLGHRHGVQKAGDEFGWRELAHRQAGFPRPSASAEGVQGAKPLPGVAGHVPGSHLRRTRVFKKRWPVAPRSVSSSAFPGSFRS